MTKTTGGATGNTAIHLTMSGTRLESVTRAELPPEPMPAPDSARARFLWQVRLVGRLVGAALVVVGACMVLGVMGLTVWQELQRLPLTTVVGVVGAFVAAGGFLVLVAFWDW